MNADAMGRSVQLALGANLVLLWASGGRAQERAPSAVAPGADVCLDGCIEAGRCTLVGDECVAWSDADCASSELCLRYGRCTAVVGRCLAAVERDCQRSAACSEDGDCFLDMGDSRCDDGTEMRDRGTFFAGLAMVSAGAAVAALGALFYVGGSIGGGRGQRIGPWMALGGGIGAVLSVPVMLVGGLHVPRDPGQTQLRIGPGHIGVSGSF